MLAYNTDVYNTLKFLHVVAAVTWVGAGSSCSTGGPVSATPGRRSRPRTWRRRSRTARRVHGGVGGGAPRGDLLVPYAPGLDFTETWVLIGLVGYVSTFLTGFLLIRPTAGKLAAVAANEGPTSREGQALIARIVAISRVDQVVLLMVIVDMVFKPGA